MESINYYNRNVFHKTYQNSNRLRELKKVYTGKGHHFFSSDRKRRNGTTLHCLYQVERPFLTHGASAHRNFQFSKALKEKIKNRILTGLEIQVHVLQIFDFDVISVSVFRNRFRRIFTLCYFDRRVWLPHPWKNVNKYSCVQENELWTKLKLKCEKCWD